MFEDVSDWVALGLHVSVVGLHATEIAEAKALNIAVLIAVTYLSLSSLEAYHLRKSLKVKRLK